jgi:hypothetical protein
MTRLGRRRLGLLAAGATLTLTAAVAVGAVAAPSGPNGDPGDPHGDSTSSAGDGIDRSSAIVQLSRAPLPTSAATAPR